MQESLHQFLQNVRCQEKNFVPALSYSEFKDSRANTVDTDEVAHYELPHLDLLCLQIYFWYLTLMHSEWPKLHRVLAVLRAIHTCDKFQRGIREVFLSFPGGFEKCIGYIRIFFIHFLEVSKFW